MEYPWIIIEDEDAQVVGKRIQSLLGDENFMSPPPKGWQRWAVPADRLGLDLEVKKLIEKTRAPKLLSRERLDESGIPCPYWHSRCIAVKALLDAREDAWTYDFERRQREKDVKAIKSIAKDIDKVISLIEKIGSATTAAPLHRAAAIHPQRFVDLRLWGEEHIADPFYKALDDFADAGPAAVRALADLREATERVKTVMTGNKTDIARLSFVASLANSWPQLTKDRAKVGDTPFASFLAAAGQAVEIECDWSSALRKVLSLQTTGARVFRF